MKILGVFLRTTLTGFVLFLLPLVVLIIVIGKAQRIAMRIMIPLAGLIPVESVRGIVVARLLAIVRNRALLFPGRTGVETRARQRRHRMAGTHRALVHPRLRLLQGYVRKPGWIRRTPCLSGGSARIEEAWQIGFLMESLSDGYHAIFVPGAPSAWSGSVYFMTEDRFQRIDMPRAEALQCLRSLGIGAAKLLEGKMPR